MKDDEGDMHKDQLLKISDVVERCKVSKATIYRWVKAGEFPAQYQLVPSGRTARWLASDIHDWLEKKKANK